ncbi:hypothetical protein [Terriglobus saanensis]|uniref:Adenylate cyclase n=1 Tax=Terriglobus saanensis (strain ATCC BAA-1853 / DSM 23119 / SP1PR4) TaxID=401053 RepID=E8V2F7_TERSS|nr:hypothetical protein [Terriglobus saanensis]ADV82375.1 hypothetical protein AciPR4_1554 [Terriglobus saanensis SP1PR4]
MPSQPQSRADERLQLLQQVVASRTFTKSPRLTKFLEFICVSLIEGHAREINEQQIGIQVFGRSPSYNAADDSIVRTQARLLRQRLEEYFEHECPEAPVVITVPRGGYIPVFEPRPTPRQALSTPSAVDGESIQAARATATRRSYFKWLLALPILAILGGAVALFYPHSTPETAADALWNQLFPARSTVFIVPSDDALVLFQEFTRTQVALDDYLSGTYQTKSALPAAGGMALNPEWFASHQYTSSADLNLALRLGRLPQAMKADVETRNARVLRIDDLKSRNVILIGGVGANPWVGLFQDRLNFDVNWDWKASEGYVRNKHPAPGEEPIYRDTLSNSDRKSYGVMAFLPGIDGNGDALLFEGTGMAGTESAADFPFSPVQFRNFARTIGATRNHMPYFEVLLETMSVGGNAPEARVVTYRLIQP